MNKFSVIIPTLWIPNTFKLTIDECIKSELIDEIIIIDNNPASDNKFNFNSNKIKILTKNENIFVNPAWNWGVSISKNENILLINDDILILNLDLILNEIIKSDYELIGLNLEKINSGNGVEIHPMIGNRKNGFGCFMFVKKSIYPEIPENIKIWYGDDFLLKKINRIGVINFDNCTIEISKTIKSLPISSEIIKSDKHNFKKLF